MAVAAAGVRKASQARRRVEGLGFDSGFSGPGFGCKCFRGSGFRASDVEGGKD